MFYPPVTKHGLLENGPLTYIEITDLPSYKPSLIDLPASRVETGSRPGQAAEAGAAMAFWQIPSRRAFDAAKLSRKEGKTKEREPMAVGVVFTTAC